MQPVSMLMSNLNVEANTHHAPNAMAVAQDTGQIQEIIRDGIKIVQTVQASEEVKDAQRVHRKNENDERGERDNSQKKRDTFEITEHKEKKSENQDKNTTGASTAPSIRENIKSKKNFEFYA